MTLQQLSLARKVYSSVPLSAARACLRSSGNTTCGFHREGISCQHTRRSTCWVSMQCPCCLLIPVYSRTTVAETSLRYGRYQHIDAISNTIIRVLRQVDKSTRMQQHCIAYSSCTDSFPRCMHRACMLSMYPSYSFV